MSEVSLEDSLSDLLAAHDQSQEPMVTGGRLNRLKRARHKPATDAQGSAPDLFDSRGPRDKPGTESEYRATPEIGYQTNPASPLLSATAEAASGAADAFAPSSPLASIDKEARDRELKEGDNELDRLIAERQAERVQQQQHDCERHGASQGGPAAGAAKKRKVIKVTRVELSETSEAPAASGSPDNEAASGAAAAAAPSVQNSGACEEQQDDALSDSQGSAQRQSKQHTGLPEYSGSDSGNEGGPAAGDDADDLHAATQRALRAAAAHDRLGRGVTVEVKPLSGILQRLQQRRQQLVLKAQQQLQPPAQQQQQQQQQSELAARLQAKQQLATFLDSLAKGKADAAGGTDADHDLDADLEVLDEAAAAAAAAAGQLGSAAATQVPDLELLLEDTQLDQQQQPAELDLDLEDADAGADADAGVAGELSDSGDAGDLELSGSEDEELQLSGSEDLAADEDEDGGSGEADGGDSDSDEEQEDEAPEGIDAAPEPEALHFEEEAERDPQDDDLGPAAPAPAAEAPAAGAGGAGKKQRRRRGLGRLVDVEAELSDEEGGALHSSDEDDEEGEEDGMLEDLIADGRDPGGDDLAANAAHVAWVEQQEAAAVRAVVHAVQHGFRGGADLEEDEEGAAARRRRAGVDDEDDEAPLQVEAGVDIDIEVEEQQEEGEQEEQAQQQQVQQHAVKRRLKKLAAVQGACEEVFLEAASSAGSREVLQLINRSDSLPHRPLAPLSRQQPEVAAAAAAGAGPAPGAAKGFHFAMFGKEGPAGGAAAGGDAQGASFLKRAASAPSGGFFRSSASSLAAPKSFVFGGADSNTAKEGGSSSRDAAHDADVAAAGGEAGVAGTRPSSFANLRSMITAGATGPGAARQRPNQGPSTLLGALSSRDRQGSGGGDLHQDMRAAMQNATFAASRLGRS